jgi:diguanylate cyclase (GGDEF)-like protein/PAS domain S-box-containing protein
MNNIVRADEPAVILVVDDEEGVRDMLRDALTHLGYTVVVAENGSQALSLFATASPDVVLLDVMMPEMSGFDVCLALRQLRGGEHVPIVMLTGVDEMSAISRAYEVGATDFLTKAGSWQILSARVRYVLRASRAAERLRTSEARLAKAQQIAKMGNWEWGIDRNGFYCSVETLRICGLDGQSQSMRYEDLWERVHPEDRERFDQAMQRVIQQRTSGQVEHRIVHPDGTERLVSHQLDVIEDQDGRACLIAGTIQDVTERKQAELLEVDRNQVLEMVIRSEPLKDILLHFVHILERQRPDGLGSVSLLKGDRLFLEAAPRLPEAFAKAMNGVTIDPKNGSCAAAAYHSKAAVAANIDESPYWESHRSVASECQIRSAIAVPIISGSGGILGTVALYYRQALTSDCADLELLAMVGKLAAIAIEQRGLSERLAHQAHHDVLTGLPNRLLLADRLEHSLAWGDRYAKKVAVVCVNLDRFKHINDSLGHYAGDQVLQEVAERLRKCTRLSDTLARTGGDEFMVVLNGIDDPHHVSNMASRLIDGLKPAFLIDQRELYVDASIGISLSPDDGQNAATLMKNADMAMHFAKDQGGNRYQYFNADMNAVANERLELENELRKALERGEFELNYQPQYELGTKRLVGAEALLRWSHPEKGRVPPDKFIPIAEETGLILPIGAWVLREACTKNAAWQSAGYVPFNIAVNVSGVQLLHVDFVDTVATVLQETGLSAKWLQLDVPESVLMRDFEIVTKRLSELRSLGISIAIDDFGTGYSTMAYVQWLPVDCLKIDSSFVHEVGASEEGSNRSRNLIKAFVGLAESFGLQLLAEGVESQEQFDFLREIGCEGGQGYLLDIPMSASDLESLCEDFMKSIR